MLDLTAAGMHSALIASNTIFLVFQFSGDLLVDSGFVVLHLAVLANQINVGIFSSRHINII